jgi:hypothetical protein
MKKLNKTTRKVKGWVALDTKGKPHLWLEGRYAVYSSTHGKDISFQRSKQPNNFVVVPCEITYSIKTKEEMKYIEISLIIVCVMFNLGFFIFSCFHPDAFSCTDKVICN